MKKSKNVFIVIALVICATVALWSKTESSEETVSDLVLENIEALAGVENLGDRWVIVDEIPCASSASILRVDESYVKCTDCKSHSGKAECQGKCTIVRPL